jgi:membrane-bound ClpP family serine protease
MTPRRMTASIAGLALALLVGAGIIWHLSSRTQPALPTAAAPAPQPPAPAPPPPAPPPPFIVVPLVGEITGETADFFRDAVVIAHRRQAKMVVLLLDTQGGSGPATRAVTDLMKEHSELRFLAYVDGSRYGGAWSAGAVLALQCERIAVRRGRGFGAAVPIFTNQKGKVEVSPEGFGELTEDLTAAANSNHYPRALVLALIDDKAPLWAVPTPDGYAFRAETPDAASGGDLIKPPGRVLALSAGECAAYGLATVVADGREAARTFGLGDADLLDHDSYKSLSAIARPQWDYLAALERLGSVSDELQDRAAEAALALRLVDEVPHELTDAALRHTALARAGRSVERCIDLLDEAQDYGSAHPRVGWAAASIGARQQKLQELQQRVQVAELEASVLEQSEAEPPAGPAPEPELPLPELTAPPAGGTLVFPVCGPLTRQTSLLFAEALDKAEAAGAKGVLLIVNSTEARDAVAPQMAMAILAHPGLRSSAYVEDAAGEAAALALCCGRLLVQNEAHLTGVDLAARAGEESPAVNKWLAGTKALYRAGAEAAGRQGAVTAALLDESSALWAVPSEKGHRFLRGMDNAPPPGSVCVRAQDRPLSLAAGDCARYGLGDPAADSAEASALLGLPGDFAQDAAYRSLLDWSRSQADAVAADKGRARQLADEATRLTDAATAPASDMPALRKQVADAARALELVDEIFTIGRRDPLIDPKPDALRALHKRLSDWLGGVNEAYGKLKG